MKYLKATPKLIAEFRANNAYPTMEKDLADLKLRDGDSRAMRMYRDKKGKLQILAPWLLADIFSI